MSEETETARATDSATNSTSTETVEPEVARDAPSMDTTVFSDFVDNAQAKIDDLQQQIQDIDVDDVIEQSTEAGKGLIDNLLAGDWLNRGELYGGAQLLLVIFLLRGPAFLDGLIGLVAGPLLVLLGGVVSGKGLNDLGSKQLSIWPAPVPGAELKTEGVYEVVRHPIYSGLLLASIGFAVSTGSPSRLALTAALGFLLTKKIQVEEEFLLDAYPGYEDYMLDVPFKILPKFF